MSTTKSTGGKITDWVDPNDKSGEFKRQVSSFRSFISREPGARFPPAKGRYHLFVSYACPWAHRTLITRKLKGLEDLISYSVVHWHLAADGWRFPNKVDIEKLTKIADAKNRGRPEEEALEGHEAGDGMDAPGVVVGAPLEGMDEFTHLREVYFSAEKNYEGRFTVPVLWDKETKTIVSNESSEIIRMLYTEFDDLLDDSHKAPAIDLYPAALRSKIDETNDWTYDKINNGVYKSGFATTHIAYAHNLRNLFEALDRAESDLTSSPGPFYFGDRVTEVDIRLYVTIVRFDPVYVQHFKCNLRDIRSGYPHLHRWMRNLYWNFPAFKDTTNMTHIKNHYTKSHMQINPLGITPLGPVPDILPLDEEVPAAVAAASK